MNPSTNVYLNMPVNIHFNVKVSQVPNSFLVLFPFLQANRPWFPARNAPSSSKRAYQRLGGFLLKMGKFSVRAPAVDYEGLQKPGVAEYISYKRQYID